MASLIRVSYPDFFGGHIESYAWTGRDSNHHRYSVCAVKNGALPTKPRGRLIRASYPEVKKKSALRPSVAVNSHLHVSWMCVFAAANRSNKQISYLMLVGCFENTSWKQLKALKGSTAASAARYLSLYFDRGESLECRRHRAVRRLG